MHLCHYIPLCDALVLLLKPLVEIVIHNRVTGVIEYINGEISLRKVGDPSLLEDELEENIDKIIYTKTSIYGRPLKSISVPIGNTWLICINCDLSVFHQMQSISTFFLSGKDAKQPQSLFKNDWQEKVHHAIYLFLQEHHLTFETLTNSQKKDLIHHLWISGAFDQKNAADYIARALNMGRATVFNYLKEWRKS